MYRTMAPIRSTVGWNLLVGLLCYTSPAFAFDRVAIDLASLQGDNWALTEPNGNLVLTAEGLGFHLTAAALTVAGEERLTNVKVQCSAFEINESYIVCLAGQASFQLVATKTTIESDFSFVYRRSDGDWRAGGRVRLEDGYLQWRATGDEKGIEVHIAANDVEAANLLPAVKSVYPKINAVSGEITDLALDLKLPFEGDVQGTFELRGRALGFDTQKGMIAAANTTGHAVGRWRVGDGGVCFDMASTLRRGEFLFGAFYTQVEGPPVRVETEACLANSLLTVERFHFDDPDAATVSGSLAASWQDDVVLRRADIRFEQLQFPGFYKDYLQAPLAQAGLGQLSIKGRASGSLRIDDAQLEDVCFTIDRLGIEDAEDRFEVTGLGGTIRWQRQGDTVVSDFGWLEAAIYRIGLGQAHVRISAVGGEVELLEPVFLPILDGGLRIEQFQIEGLLDGMRELLIDAELVPVSMGALTAALDWPAMEGKISGYIPKLTLKDGVYRLGGTLVLSVFGGAIEVANLRVERPFGVLPKLAADIEIDYLDLSRLTSVFTFGKIRGQLSGYVRNLRLLNWMPVHFDAMLRTPPGDDSEHRISQRAVDTLSSLGGGGPGALSSTFLQIFDDFAYEALGLSCELNGNVCHMGGVAPAPDGGYYIVEGSGIPRVDVIGYVRWVDWPLLVEQLIASIQGNPPTVGEPDS